MLLNINFTAIISNADLNNILKICSGINPSIIFPKLVPIKTANTKGKSI